MSNIPDISSVKDADGVVRFVTICTLEPREGVWWMIVDTATGLIDGHGFTKRGFQHGQRYAKAAAKRRINRKYSP
ncbi:MAG: hypothetical protein AB7U75_13860 [Hyphomicrobiaceae bacterium]